ncbi:BREX-1 system adenine-specific DNA-methyltransferase PglX [Propioniciclava soli]|uniref:BREX-1 system adenine-specific DNA-methyltransferase PglX n=1 Tax=Propioniciclava soli TaxID=2775081 RepID=UPI001E57B90F|nr:BREX-1 system adenine-specific DNA-methyltransferase PglX [Propioniciclava soli]
MQTAPLKSFATWARTSLIREVTARIAVVLAPSSAERVEQLRSVEALEKAVAAAGGGDKGRAAVADKVAYTWFNRIIALRFMDANGYTSVGVVSPQAGVATGQPEILAEAKRGNIDTGVVSGKTRETVASLLNGTRRSADAQGEAYALLLADYCRHWNRAMPFMFEREGDFTELLIPGNLLSDDSVPSRAVKVLTKDVCHDVEVIGWLYQFYISERKDEVFAGFKKSQKAGADEIPAATQLFTPHWIVRYLVENSLGRLWMLNRPTSHLVDQMQYYIAPIDGETESLKIARPEELKVVDPACGSGHMLTYAFDLLYAIYEEEGYAPAEIPSLILTNNLYGVEIDARAGALAAFALTMKARAKQRTFFNKQIQPNVCVLDPISFTPDEIDFLLTRDGDKHEEVSFWNQFAEADTFGSLVRPDPTATVRLARHAMALDASGDIFKTDVVVRAKRVVVQARYLTPRYAVVVANPPYMQSDNMNEALREMAQSSYPDTKADLFAMFIERNRALALPNAVIGMITMNSWLYLKSFESLRRAILFKSRLLSLVDLGTGAFPTIPGQVVAAAAFLMANTGNSGGAAVFVDGTSAGSSWAKERLLLDAVAGVDLSHRAHLSPSIFSAVPGAQVLLSIDANMLRQFAEWAKVGDYFEPRAGISTGRNSEFIRLWFEVCRSDISTTVPPTGRWKLHNKGGGGERRWYGNLDYVLRYDDHSVEQMQTLPGFRHDGKERYFQPHVGWSKVSTKSPAFRFYPGGMTFDSGGLGLFARSEEDLYRVLLYLNSRLARTLIEAVSPTLNLSPGQLEALPLPPLDAVPADSVRDVVDSVRRMWEWNEEAWGFSRLRLLEEPGTLRDRVETAGRAETALAEGVLARIRSLEIGAGWGAEEGPDVPSRVSGRTARSIVGDLVSYAVGCIFGRFALDEPGLILADQGATVQDYLAKVPNPTFAPDKDNVIPIVDGDWFEDDVVARFRTFLRVAFGEQHFEENLRFVTASLGVRDVRDYFVKSFYKDHVQRYRKRPIYWLFSSPKGSFNALIYMHRYTPSTVSTVLNEYLREFMAKLSSSLQQQERLAVGGGTPRQQAAAQKEADRLRKVLLELEEYEHDVLYPLASRQLAIDLDDGVKANYPKFGAALKKIPGLEAADE